MTQELLYTSAPRGLKPGSSGFCTVVCTQGMAVNLAGRLESLSGYRHVYQPHDSNAHRNPVVYSHLLLSVGRQPYHVLSRIAAAGVDYTQRTNKIAHHLVLEPGETPPAGPAWTLLPQQGLMETQWDGQARVLPAGRKVPRIDASPAVCAAWQSLAGDAGWGGVLAETAMATPARQAVLIFRPGQDLLPLVAESLALLPPDVRWRTTFSTYYTKLPVGVDCQWRCLLEGSPELAALRRTPQLLVLDLRSPLGAPPPGQWTEAARTGVVPQLPQVRKPTLTPAPHAVKASDQELDALMPRTAADSPDATIEPGDATPYGVQATPPPIGALAKPATSPPYKSGVDIRRKKSQKAMLSGIAVLAAVIAIATWATLKWFAPQIPLDMQIAESIPNAGENGGNTQAKRGDTSNGFGDAGSNSNVNEPGKNEPRTSVVTARPNPVEEAAQKAKDLAKKKSEEEHYAIVLKDIQTTMGSVRSQLSTAMAKRKAAVVAANNGDAAAAKTAASEAAQAATKATQFAREVKDGVLGLPKDRRSATPATSFVPQCDQDVNFAVGASQIAANAATLAQMPNDVPFPWKELQPQSATVPGSQLPPIRLATGKCDFLSDSKNVTVKLNSFCSLRPTDTNARPACNPLPGMNRHRITFENHLLGELWGDPQGVFLSWVYSNFGQARQSSLIPENIQYGKIVITYTYSQSAEDPPVVRAVSLRQVQSCRPITFTKSRKMDDQYLSRSLLPEKPNDKLSDHPIQGRLRLVVAAAHTRDAAGNDLKNAQYAPSNTVAFTAGKTTQLPDAIANANFTLKTQTDVSLVMQPLTIVAVGNDKDRIKTHKAIDYGVECAVQISFPNYKLSKLPSWDALTAGDVSRRREAVENALRVANDELTRITGSDNVATQKRAYWLENQTRLKDAASCLNRLQKLHDALPSQIIIEGRLELWDGKEFLTLATFRDKEK